MTGNKGVSNITQEMDSIILTVERHSFLIAFVLMGVTAVILIIGTAYVWHFHHHGNTYDDDPQALQSDQISTIMDDDHPSQDTENQEQSSETKEADKKVRKRRTSSSSSGTNNNNSPLKSKIPVRMKNKQS